MLIPENDPQKKQFWLSKMDSRDKAALVMILMRLGIGLIFLVAISVLAWYIDWMLWVLIAFITLYILSIAFYAMVSWIKGRR